MMDQTQERLATRFPGALWHLVNQMPELLTDQHSLIYGESKRWRNLMRAMVKARIVNRRQDYSPDVAHDYLLRIIHGFFVGDMRDASRQHAAMYQGTPADFERDSRLWSEACEDVEAVYAHLLRYLPRLVMLDGRSRDLHHLLHRPEEVSGQSDLIKLLDLVWRPGPDLAGDLMRHHARLKLIFAQFYFELRRQGLAPDDWEHGAAELDRFVKRQFFGNKRGEKVAVVAKLDPRRSYRCRSWDFVPEDRAPTPSATRVVVPATLYHLPLPNGAGKTRLLYFSRVKRDPLLKALRKGIRFARLTGLGDSVGLMFVVEREFLDQVVKQARRVLVPCPGQVFDQQSALGESRGRRLDPGNKRSSRNYEAMKYVATMFDLMVEVQFLPVQAWLDSRFSHNRLNHGLYKLGIFTKAVLTFLFPESLTGIPWESRALQDQLKAHVLKRENNGYL